MTTHRARYWQTLWEWIHLWPTVSRALAPSVWLRLQWDLTLEVVFHVKIVFHDKSGCGKRGFVVGCLSFERIIGACWLFFGSTNVTHVLVHSYFFSWVLPPQKTKWWLVWWKSTNLQKHAFDINQNGIMVLAEKKWGRGLGFVASQARSKVHYIRGIRGTLLLY